MTIDVALRRLAALLGGDGGIDTALSLSVALIREALGAAGVGITIDPEGKKLSAFDGEPVGTPVRAPFDVLDADGEVAVHGSVFGTSIVETIALCAGLALATRQLRASAATDALTGVANRRAFDDSLTIEWQRAARESTSLSLLMLDIDYFKVFNDRYGHQAGDECLRRVARAAAATLQRGGDRFARYGGEEFAVVLPATPLDGAITAAERMRAAVAALGIPHPINPGGHVTISVGAAAADPSCCGTMDELLAAADAALFRAKAAGRDRVAGGDYVSLEPARAGEAVPIPLSRFIGRDDDVKTIAAALERAPVVTLAGQSGVGKTRLGLAAATAVAPRFARVAFVDVLGARDHDELIAKTTAAFGVDRAASGGPFASVAEALGERGALLVLDNAEQLAGASASLAAALAAIPGMRILATCRSPLGVPGEEVLPIGPLDDDRARALFVERAGEAGALLDADDPDVAAVVASLHGNALAIELAAALARVTSLTDLRRALIRDVSSSADGEAAFRTLIDAALEGLPPDDAVAFAALSLFRTSFGTDAAAAVIPSASGDERKALEALTRFTSRSLVLAESHAGVTRFRLLDLVRAVAEERLEASPHREELIAGYVEHVLARMHEFERRHGSGAGHAWLADVEREIDDVRGALDRAAADTQLHPSGSELFIATLRYWASRGLYEEGRTRATAFLHDAHALAPRRRAALHNAAANLAYGAGDIAAMQDAAEHALAALDGHDDTPEASPPLNYLGVAAKMRGDYDLAEAFFRRAVTLNRRLGNQRGAASAIGALGSLALEVRLAFAEAWDRFSESRSLFEAIGDEFNAMVMAGNLVETAAARGEYVEARRLSDATLAETRAFGAEAMIAWMLIVRVTVCERGGDLPEAIAAIREASVTASAIDNAEHAVLLADAAARIATAVGDDRCAAFVTGIADRRAADARMAFVPVVRYWRDATIAAVESRIGRDAVAAERARGRDLAPAEATRALLDAIAGLIEPAVVVPSAG